MTPQTALTESPPIILDATCSYGRRWPRFETIRIDIRPEVHPDFVMDAKHTNFPDYHFDEIYCDPPHIVRKSPLSGMEDIYQRYGWWKSRSEWIDFLRQTNIEFFRILKLDGVLHYKITDGATFKGETGGATHLRELIREMTNFEITKDRITESKNHVLKSKSKVHWLILKPKPCHADILLELANV